MHIGNITECISIYYTVNYESNTKKRTSGVFNYHALHISYVKEMLQICIRNSYHATHRKDSSGRYLTTKKDTLDHGIGLSSVEQAVSCYHGEMTAEGTGNEFRVSVVMYGSDGEK